MGLTSEGPGGGGRLQRGLGGWGAAHKGVQGVAIKSMNNRVKYTNIHFKCIIEIRHLHGRRAWSNNFCFPKLVSTNTNNVAPSAHTLD